MFFPQPGIFCRVSLYSISIKSPEGSVTCSYGLGGGTQRTVLSKDRCGPRIGARARQVLSIVKTKYTSSSYPIVTLKIFLLPSPKPCSSFVSVPLHALFILHNREDVRYSSRTHRSCTGVKASFKVG
jgi:hypothetical protein